MKSSLKPIAKQLKRYLNFFGPGFITGASNNDPSAITSYTQAGAKFGPQLLWATIVTYPFTVVILKMCARIRWVTRKGIIAVIKQHYPKPVLYFIVTISFSSILINISADIEMAGSVAHLLNPSIPAFGYSIIFSAMLLIGIIQLSYQRIIFLLKILCVALLSYVVIPFLTDGNNLKIQQIGFLPVFNASVDYYLLLAAIIGSSISPYLFFWQTTVAIEEAKITRRKDMYDKIVKMYGDIKRGLFFGNFISFFIVLAAANALYAAGIHQVETPVEAAESLRPLAGKIAFLLFSVGIVGTGLIAVPVLGGALSYIIAETFGWKKGLNMKFHQAKGFYLTLICSLIIAVLFHVVGVNPVKALLFTAIMYGLIAPILVAVILMICNNKKILGTLTNKRSDNILGISALVLMIAIVFALIYFQVNKVQ